MLPLGALFAYVSRQLGRVLSVVFSWATTTLFGRVPQRKQLILTLMAVASLTWPVALLGTLVPSFATFLLAFVTLPSWADAWVRPVMLLLALALPAGVGLAARQLAPPDGTPVWRSALRGYPTAAGLCLVLAWMVVLAPAVRIQAVLRRWTTDHAPIAIKEGGYDRVLLDVAAALGRAGIAVRAEQAGWAFQLPGRILARLGGPRVRRFVPPRLVKLVGDGIEIVVHPMDLSMRGTQRTVSRARAAIARELTFTEAYQTWSEEAQRLEDRLARAARGADDLDDIGRRIADLAIDHEQWEVLYRLFLQVRLRRSPTETDALVREQDGSPTLARRLRVLGGVLWHHLCTGTRRPRVFEENAERRECREGVRKGELMATVQKSVVVDVPVRTAYDQWTQFEEFPRFMGGVASVQQLDDKRLHWKAEILGKDKEWDAEIVEQTPDRLVSWRSTGGAPNAGTVTFSPQGDGKTKVDLRIDYTPEDPADQAGDWLGVLDRQVDGDLKRFKEFIEQRGAPTGAWRGEIHGGKVEEREEEPTTR